MISSVLPVYGRSKLKFEKGNGVHLYTEDGTRYLDFAAGIAVNALGHAHPHLVEALQSQAEKLWHVSNMYEIKGLKHLADRLVEATFADTVFFCNSGAEAIECAIKMVRKYHDETGNPDRFHIITFKDSFHGRTLAAASASGRDKCIAGFEPAVEGFTHVPYGDLEAVKEAITDETGAIMIEPIQGEGGIKPAPEGFMKALRELCDEHGLLLVCDEIQCGLARTGKLYAHEHAEIEPDILTTAKGIGNGFPLGACLATEKAACGMTQGTHGSTYGGNPLAMAVGNAVLDVVLNDEFLRHVNDAASYLKEQLEGLQKKFPKLIKSIRGLGLMLGVQLTEDSVPFVQELREEKLLTVAAADNVIRILPPLIIEKEHIDEAIEKLEAVFKKHA